MRRARLISGLAAIVFVGSVAVIATSLARRQTAHAVRDGCATLGNPANFVAFSEGAFNSSEASGTSITGRIAAAGDVTLDGISVGPAAGDSTPTVIAGSDFTAGRTTGHGGMLNGGVRYGASIDVAPNFTVNGERTHSPPPFSFVSEFDALRDLSQSWAKLGQTSGATVTLDPNSKALQLTGKGSGLNVFTVSAADLKAAAGIVIDLTQANATALINITTTQQLTIAPQYMSLSGSANGQRLTWNLPNAAGLAVTHGVAWKGLILAPDATATSSGRPQLSGQLIAGTIPTSDWVLTYVPFTGCLPPGVAYPNLSSTASASVRLVARGAPISDVARLSGGATPTGTITFKLLGPNDEDCTGSAVFSSTSTAAGNGYYGSGSFTPERAGTYRWVVDYSGDQNNRPAGPTACDDVAEAAIVRPAAVVPAVPALSTTASPSPSLGAPLYDTARLTGGLNPGGAITFELFGPDDQSCAKPPAFTATAEVNGNGAYRSAAFIVPQPGTYRWVATYSGDLGNTTAGPTACTDAAETAVVGSTPDPTPDHGPNHGPVKPPHRRKPAHRPKPPPPPVSPPPGLG